MEAIQIDRKYWKCYGHGEGDPSLLNAEGYSCVMGFIAIGLGIKEDEVCNLTYPSDDQMDETNISRDLVNRAIQINDAGSCTQEERERRLVELFKERNIKLEFVGEFE